jgi:AraC-like DNA-binding protein
MYGMQYGDEVEITPDLYRDFMLVRISLKNGIEVDADGRITYVPEGAIFFSAPQQYVRVRWQEDCQQLLVRVPLRLLRAEDEKNSPLIRSGHVLAPAMAPLFVDQLNLALNISRYGKELENYGEWIEYVETALARFAGLQLFEKVSPLSPCAPDRRPERDRRERLESFIHARLRAPITLDNLTAAVGVGRSQLNLLCREAFDCTPMMLVRRIRLEAARADLEVAPSQDLTHLSLRYGFEHQSRFAQYYRSAFGELPREARRRLRG